MWTDRRIGIGFSGGGYRAAAWGLGVVLYLADAGLQRHVATISSVSGGSFTNGALGLERYGQMEPEEVDQFAAGLARRLSGNLKAFVLALSLHLIAWGGVIFAAGKHEGVWALVAVGAAVLLSLTLGPASADATFSSRLMWLYCDVLASSLALLAFTAGEAWWWLAALVGTGVLLLLRGVLVGWAIGRSVLRQTKKGALLSDLSSDIEHVLCACDLHGRHHVYFGRDFVYSYGLGLGARPSLALSAAVQASANLPFAFPPRPMRAAPFHFTGARYHAPVLALTDGGVYDNMAEEWLLSFSERTERFLERAKALRDDGQRAALLAVAERLSQRQPNFVVVANASGPLGFKFAWTTFLPLVGELFALLRVKSILYDNGHTTRRRLLVDEFMDGDLLGIIVHISTDPWSVVDDGRKAHDRAIRARAEAAARRLESTPGLDPDTTKTPASAGTVLYPLGRGRIARLMQRSYALACIQGHIWHDLPLVAIPPLEWFGSLEAGRAEMRPAPAMAVSIGVSPKGLDSSAKSVPVSVDAIREVGETRMARVTYFVIASEVPEPLWVLGAEVGSRFSVEALGLLGVICGPGVRTPLFRHLDHISSVFEEIESSPGLSVQLEDLWIPLGWLEPAGREPDRGDVYRVDMSLFQAAYRFRTAEIDEAEFASQTPWQGLASFSPEETRAFNNWAEASVQEARLAYPKDDALKLRYEENAV